MKKYFLVSILLLLGTMLGTATAQIITGKVTDLPVSLLTGLRSCFKHPIPYL